MRYNLFVCFTALFVFAGSAIQAAPIKSSWLRKDGEVASMQTEKDCTRKAVEGKSGAFQQICTDLDVRFLTYDGKNGRDGKSVKVTQLMEDGKVVGLKITGPDGVEHRIRDGRAPTEAELEALIRRIGLSGGMTLEDADQRYAFKDEAASKYEVQQLRSDIYGEVKAIKTMIAEKGALSSGQSAASQSSEPSKKGDDTPAPEKSADEKKVEEKGEGDFDWLQKNFGLNLKLGSAMIQSFEFRVLVGVEIMKDTNLQLEFGAGLAYLPSPHLEAFTQMGWLSGTAGVVLSRKFNSSVTGELGGIVRAAGDLTYQRQGAREYALRLGLRFGKVYVGGEIGNSPKGWLAHPDGTTNYSVIVGAIW